MKQIAFAVAAALAAAAQAKVPSKAEIAEADKKNWGDVAYTAATGADGATVETDLLKLKTALGRETVTMKSIYAKVKDALEKGSDDPDKFHAEALKLMARPLDPLPPLKLAGGGLSQQEELGVKSIKTIRHAIAKFDREVRTKAREALRLDGELKLMYRYNRLLRAKKLIGAEGAFLKAWIKLDDAYADFLKIADQIEKGQGSWNVKPEQVMTLEQRAELFKRAMASSKLNWFFDAKGAMLPKIDRNARALDRILKRISDAELKTLDSDSSRFATAHNAVATAEKDFSEWFAQSGVSMDPGPRAYLKDLVMGYRKFIKEEHQTIALGLYNIIEEFNSESSVVGRLRKCNFTKHRAFFADGTEATGGTPHYTRRIGFLGKAVKARFEKAVRAVFQRHGKPMIL